MDFELDINEVRIWSPSEAETELARRGMGRPCMRWIEVDERDARAEIRAVGPHCEAPPSYKRSSEAHRAPLAAEGVRRVGVKLARSLLLSANTAFTVGVIALAVRASLAATVLFMVSAVGFLATLVLLRRR